MNKEKLTWEAPTLYLEDIYSTSGGIISNSGENPTYFITSGVG